MSGSDGENLPVRRGRVDSLVVYEVTENELETLERGSPSSLMLNLSLFCLSGGLTGLTALATATLVGLAQTTFVVVTVFGLGVGAILLLLWFKYKEDVSAVSKKVRGRLVTAPDCAPPVLLPGLPAVLPAGPTEGEDPPTS